MPTCNIRIAQSAEALAQYACGWLVEQIQHHVSVSKQRYAIALSGGSTPKRLYQLLGDLPSGTIDWGRIILIWGDERNVPHDHEDSNFRMVRENLLDRIEIPDENVWRVPNAGGEPAQAARDYAATLKQLPQAENGLPCVDLVLLGVGDDVHTASLFPETKALTANDEWVVENWVEKLGCWRITLTAPLLNAARKTCFLIAGEGKRDALKTIWHGPRDTQRFPAQLIEPTYGDLWFMLDRAAVSDTKPPADADLQYLFTK